MITIEHIRSKVAGGRISEEEGLWLYEDAALEELLELAGIVRKRWNGNDVFYNKNIHIEPTNICANGCVFCGFARQSAGEKGAFALSAEEVKTLALHHKNSGITEVHVTGGVHPEWQLADYAKIIAAIREALPKVHIKAFTAEEIWKMHSSSHLTIAEVLAAMRLAGLGSLAGGGAEILVDGVRTKICPNKIKSAEWLSVHREAHGQGIGSNATMLYGHVESYGERIVHLSQIRALQDATHGFNAFIPLKYRRMTAALPAANETTIDDDCRNMAVCRIFLDNIAHLKAYLPALGAAVAAAMLHYGADDMDGTIYDGTKIYADQNAAAPTGISITALQELCGSMGLELKERDSNYQIIG